LKVAVLDAPNAMMIDGDWGVLLCTADLATAQ